MLQSRSDSWTAWARLYNDILKPAKQYIILKSVVCA